MLEDSKKAAMLLLGFGEQDNLDIRELRKHFKRKYIAMLPEKHPTVPNAHSKFEEIINAFVQLVNHLKSSGDITTLMPGDIFVANFQFTIQLSQNSGNAWKKAIRQSYPNVIIGSQKQSHNLNMKGTKGRGVRHVVYWKHTNESGVQPLKVNLIIYENDVLQVTGSSFYLWILECYPGMVKLVEFIQQETQMKSGGCEDPDCICGGRGGDEDFTSLQSSSCGTVQFKSILECLEQMEEEMGSLKEKVSDFSAAHRVHEERCINDDITTTNKIVAMNEKVLEIRQLVGVDALSKGLASFKLINEMRRNAKIDESGFMVPLDDQVIEEEKVKVPQEESEKKKVCKSSSPKRAAPKSPRKLQESMSRKESIRAKSNDPKHNWKILSDTIGFTNEENEENEEKTTSTTSISSDSFEEKIIEKEKPTGKVRRSKSPVKKK